MSKNLCQMCYTSCEVKHGEYTLQVCPECKDKFDQEQVYQRIQPLVEKLCRELNGGDKRRVAQALCDAFNREHRYLQSEAFSALWLFFERYGKQEEGRYFDGRNQHCRSMAEKWYKAII